MTDEWKKDMVLKPIQKRNKKVWYAYLFKSFESISYTIKVLLDFQLQFYIDY